MWLSINVPPKFTPNSFRQGLFLIRRTGSLIQNSSIFYCQSFDMLSQNSQVRPYSIKLGNIVHVSVNWAQPWLRVSELSLTLSSFFFLRVYIRWGGFELVFSVLLSIVSDNWAISWESHLMLLLWTKMLYISFFFFFFFFTNEFLNDVSPSHELVTHFSK